MVWTRSKTVLMSLILIAAFLTVFLSFSLQTYLTSKQTNPALYQSEEFSCSIEYINGSPVQGPGVVLIPLRAGLVSLPHTLNMGDPSTLHYYYFGIYLDSLTKIHLSFEATAPINFRLVLDLRNDSLDNWVSSGELGQAIVNETQTTHLDSEFYLMDPGFYILVFEPIITRPAATVMLNVQLD
jgi:hypothetical protein